MVAKNNVFLNNSRSNGRIFKIPTAYVYYCQHSHHENFGCQYLLWVCSEKIKMAAEKPDFANSLSLVQNRAHHFQILKSTSGLARKIKNDLQKTGCWLITFLFMDGFSNFKRQMFRFDKSDKRKLLSLKIYFRFGREKSFCSYPENQQTDFRNSNGICSRLIEVMTEKCCR